MLFDRLLCAAATLAMLSSCATPERERTQELPMGTACQVGTPTVPAVALLDGVQPGAVGLLAGAGPGQLDAALAAAGLRSSDPVAVHAFLLSGSGRRILIDAGGGAALPPYRGQMEEQLRAAGVAPDQVTDILLTHLHADHVGGLARAGVPVFPRAVIHVHAADARFWLDPALAQRMPPLRPVLEAIQASLAPYVKAGRLATFEYGAEVVPGVRALDAGGHTPGHTAYLAGGGAEAVLAAGDLLHVPPVQAAHPEIGMRFETGEVQARASRERLLAQAAAAGWTLLAAHADFPGAGQLVARGAAYTWQPRTQCGRVP